MSGTATLGLAIRTSGLGRAARQMNALVSQTDKGACAAERFEKAWSGAARTMSGLSILGTTILTLSKQLYEAAAAGQVLELSFKTVFGSSQAAAAQMEWLRGVAKKLGKNYYELADSYKNISAVSRGTNLEGEKTQAIFKAITTASTALGLSSEQTKGSLDAIAQMMSKGNVQAEELSGQLGKRLPGAFNLAAEAMGVTSQQLNKMVDSGEILASDLLPKLAKVLTDQYGKAAIEASTKGQSSMNRFDEVATDLVTTIGTKLKPAFDDILGVATDVLNVTNEWLNLDPNSLENRIKKAKEELAGLLEMQKQRSETFQESGNPFTAIMNWFGNIDPAIVKSREAYMKGVIDDANKRLALLREEQREQKKAADAQKQAMEDAREWGASFTVSLDQRVQKEKEANAEIAALRGDSTAKELLRIESEKQARIKAGMGAFDAERIAGAAREKLFADLAKKRTEAGQKLADDLELIGLDSHEKALVRLEQEKAAHLKATKDKELVEQWYNAKKAEIAEAAKQRLKAIERELENQSIEMMEDGVAKRIALHEEEQAAAYSLLAERLAKTKKSQDEQIKILSKFLESSEKKFKDSLLTRNKYTKAWADEQIKEIKKLGLTEEETWKAQADIYARHIKGREDDTRRHIENLKVLLKKDMVGGFEVALAEMQSQFKSHQQFMYEGWKQTGEAFKNLFGDVLYNGFTDGLDGIVDTFADFGKSLLRMWTRIIGEMIYQWMASQLFRGLNINIGAMGVGGGGGQGGLNYGGMAQAGQAAYNYFFGGATASAAEMAGYAHAASQAAAWGATGVPSAGVPTSLMTPGASAGTSAMGMAGSAMGYIGAAISAYQLFDLYQNGPGGMEGAMSGMMTGAMGGTMIYPGIGTLIGAIVGALAGGLGGGGNADVEDRINDAKRFGKIAKDLTRKSNLDEDVDVDKYLEAINAAHRSDNRVDPKHMWALYNQLKSKDKLPWWAGNPDQIAHIQGLRGTEWGQPDWMRYRLFGKGGLPDETGDSGMAQWFGKEGKGPWGGEGNWDKVKAALDEMDNETLDQLGEALFNVKEGAAAFGVDMAELMGKFDLAQLESGEWATILKDELSPASLMASMNDKMRAEGMNNLEIAAQKQAAAIDSLLGTFNMSEEDTDAWMEQLFKANAEQKDLSKKMEEYQDIVKQLKNVKAGEEEKTKKLIERGRQLREELGLGESAFSKIEKGFEKFVTAMEAIAKRLTDAANGKEPEKPPEKHHGGLIYHSGGMVGAMLNAGMITAHGGSPRMHHGGLRPDERLTVLQAGEFVIQRSSVNAKTLGALRNINATGQLPKGAEDKLGPDTSGLSHPITNPDDFGSIEPPLDWKLGNGKLTPANMDLPDGWLKGKESGAFLEEVANFYLKAGHELENITRDAWARISDLIREIPEPPKFHQGGMVPGAPLPATSPAAQPKGGDGGKPVTINFSPQIKVNAESGADAAKIEAAVTKALEKSRVALKRQLEQTGYQVVDAQ